MYRDNDMPKDDVWCGSWRPTRRRGPILAQFNSPGPKYLLPGLTGAHQHDPTKYRAPMYSFSSRLEVANKDCSPGPKYLLPSSVTRFGRGGTSGVSLYRRLKEPQPNPAPGPGKYCPDRSQLIFPSAPAYSLSGRNTETNKNLTPGPANYNLPSLLGSQNSVAPSAPSYTMSGHNEKGGFHKGMQNTPGPATYNAANSSITRSRPPQYSMAGRHFLPNRVTKTPGPGAYVPEKATLTTRAAPSFSFGIHHSQYITPLIIKDEYFT